MAIFARGLVFYDVWGSSSLSSVLGSFTNFSRGAHPSVAFYSLVRKIACDTVAFGMYCVTVSTRARLVDIEKYAILS